MNQEMSTTCIRLQEACQERSLREDDRDGGGWAQFEPAFPDGPSLEKLLQKHEDGEMNIFANQVIRTILRKPPLKRTPRETQEVRSTHVTHTSAPVSSQASGGAGSRTVGGRIGSNPPVEVHRCQKKGSVS